MDFSIMVSRKEHSKHAIALSEAYARSAKERGIGIAVRKPSYLKDKIENGQAIIVLQGTELVGFCYIESWSHGAFVAHSGLIVLPEFRGQKLSTSIKEAIFKLSRNLYPTAKIFGITTNPTVMKINASLGYIPVAYKNLTEDPTFWKGCQTCPNYNILAKNDFKMCMCTAMLFEENNIQLLSKINKDA